MAGVLLTNEFDESKINFGEPKKNTMGGSNVLISYNNGNGNTPLVIQTPRLRAPFGSNCQVPEGGGPNKYSVNLSVSDGDNSVGKFFNIIKNIEKAVKDTGVKNSELWFGKKKSSDVVDELMRSIVKYPKDTKYNPTIKFKLPYNDKGPQFNLEDENKQSINVWVEGNMDLSCIEPGCEMTAIIQCTGVYFIGKTQFGIGFKILKARVYSSNQLKNLTIVDDEEEEEAYEDY
jgi:hypothetical protein